MATTIARSVASTRGPDVPAVIAAPAFTATVPTISSREAVEFGWQSLFHVTGPIGAGVTARTLQETQRSFIQYATGNKEVSGVSYQLIPARADANSQTGARDINPWRSGDGESTTLIGNGSIAFTTAGDDSVGRIVGLVFAASGWHLTSYTHAFVFNGDGSVDAFDGELTPLAGIIHTGVFKFTVAAGVVTFYVDDVLVHTGAAPSTATTRLCASFLSTDDVVSSITLTGGSAASGLSTTGTSAATAGSATAAASDIEGYASSHAVSPLPTGVAYADMPIAPGALSYAGIPSAVGVSFGYAVGTGTSNSTVPAASGLAASSIGYASSAGQYALRAVGASHDVAVPETTTFDTVLVGGEMDMFADLIATFVSSVDLTDSVALVIELIEGMEWFDVLLSSGDVNFLADRDAQWGDTLAVTDQADAAARTGIQYATNIMTNAITSYDGFDFLSFVTLPSGTYGLRADGLYKIESGSDSGAARDAHVDFGANLFGSVHNKHLDSVFFGLTVDGTPMAVIAGDDGVKRAYTVIKRAEFMRADLGKGRLAKRWSLRLEVYDATQAELDAVELVVRESSRRWIK